jgi:hypothetical protein
LADSTNIQEEDLKKVLRGQTIRQFDRKNVRELIKEMNKKLQVLEVTYGVKIRMGKKYLHKKSCIFIKMKTIY